jgi:lipoprotein-anchoring transpeptidase ErfK/SrfK
VIAPQLHNGRLGWIPSGGAQLTEVHYSIRIETRRHLLTVFRDGRIVRTMPAAVGRAGTATPAGQFAVTDKLHFRPLSQAYGCCALALSAHEYNLGPDWTGGNLVAIHSTPDAASIGKSVSHGCVRVSLSQGRWLVNNVPLGTVVTVRHR